MFHSSPHGSAKERVAAAENPRNAGRGNVFSIGNVAIAEGRRR